MKCVMKKEMYKVRIMSCAFLCIIASLSLRAQTAVSFPNESNRPENTSGLEKANVYPNPVTNKFQIAGLPENSNVVLVNLLGVQVLEIKSAAGTEEVDVSRLSPGIYFLKLFDKEGDYEVKRLIKE